MMAVHLTNNPKPADKLVACFDKQLTARHAYGVVNRQQGFTLIEVLVALTIFAMLAVAGWQIMASITKSRDRANLRLAQLSQLQYAYLQVSQDFTQTIDYVGVPPTLHLANRSPTDGNVAIKPTFTLSADMVDFRRFANPDPRQNPPPMLARVVYRIQDGKLIKQRFYQPNNPDETPNSSVLLSDIKDAQWTALTPKPVTSFPDAQTLQQTQTSATMPLPTSPSLPNSQASQNSQLSPPQAALDLTAYRQLPKGVELRFTYQEQPIVWRFALPASLPPASPALVPTVPTGKGG